LINFSFQKKLK